MLRVRNELKNRGVEDIQICPVNGLNDFSQAIRTIYPQTIVTTLHCHTKYAIAHSYVCDKDMKEFMRDGKRGISTIYP